MILLVTGRSCHIIARERNNPHSFAIVAPSLDRWQWDSGTKFKLEAAEDAGKNSKKSLREDALVMALVGGGARGGTNAAQKFSDKHVTIMKIKLIGGRKLPHFSEYRACSIF